ncbi:hypothetical protein D9M69_705670 [compost metagenome]
MRFCRFPGNDAAVAFIFIFLRQRDCLNTKKRAFHGASNSAGIGHIISHVRTGIDARQDEVRRFRQNMPNAHDHAIGRRAAQREMTIIDLPQTKRLGQSQ